MARVLIATQSWSPITRNALGVLQIQATTSVAIANPDGTAATTWSAQTGGTSSTAAQLTDSNGNLQRWIEEGEYDVTVSGESAKRVQAVGAPESGNTIYVNAGLAAPGAAVQAAIDRVAATAADGQVVLRSGTHTWETVPTVPPNLTAKLVIRGTLGTKVVAQTGANRFLDPAAGVDYDTYRKVEIRDLKIDRNNISINRHVVFGTMPAATWTTKRNFDDITIDNVTTVNVPFDITATNLNPNVWIYPGADADTDTLCSVKNITVSNCDFAGGNFGVTIGGVWRTSGHIANVFVDNIKVHDVKWDSGVTPSGSPYTSACLFLVGRGYGGRVRVWNIDGKGSGDVGIEVDGAADFSARACTMEDCLNAAFYHTNFRVPLTKEQRISWQDCHGKRTGTAAGVGFKTEKASSVWTGTGTTTSGSPTITVVATTTGTLEVGQALTGATGVPGGVRIGSLGAGTIGMVDIDGNAFNATASNSGVVLAAHVLPGPVSVSADSTWHRATADFGANGDAVYVSDSPSFDVDGLKANIEGFNNASANSGNAVRLTATSSGDRCRFSMRNSRIRINGTSSNAGSFYAGVSNDRGDWTFDFENNTYDINVASSAGAHTAGISLGVSSVIARETVIDRERFKMGVTGDTGPTPITIGATSTLTISRKIRVRDCSVRDCRSTTNLITYAAPSNAANVIESGTERNGSVGEYPIAAITPGASPYNYQNLDGYREEVVVQGGTVSKIEYSTDNSAFTDLGVTQGKTNVEPGQYLRVTYSVVPTMTKIPRR